jgi:hypothetical protein
MEELSVEDLVLEYCRHKRIMSGDGNAKEDEYSNS